MNFPKIAKPFTVLTQKNRKDEWGVEQEEAFQTWKDNLCNVLILSLPFVIYRDASNQGLGCVLMQRGKLIANYDYEIRYHPSKVNVVADALSKKERVKPKRVRAMYMTIQSSLKEKLLDAKNEAIKEENTPAEMLHGFDQQMEKRGDGETVEFAIIAKDTREEMGKITIDFITKLSRSSGGYNTI
nr:reverse transcriptase domain-containing protein [Tanacetum cinerariifolium]